MRSGERKEGRREEKENGPGDFRRSLLVPNSDDSDVGNELMSEKLSLELSGRNLESFVLERREEGKREQRQVASKENDGSRDDSL